MLDVFKSDAFGVISMTDAINKLPYIPGRVSRMGLFDERGVPTTSISIEEKAGVLTLVQTSPRGAPAVKNVGQKRTVRKLTIPHIAIEDELYADEVQGVREFGTEDQLASVTTAVNDKLQTLSNNLDVTLEHLRLGAVKGIVLDADGTEIYDIFSEFGVSQINEIDFDLDNANPASGALRKKIHGMIRAVEDEMGAMPYDHIHGLVSAEFMDDLVSHKEFIAAYSFPGGDQKMLQVQLARRSVEYAGVIFEEYRGKLGSTTFIPADKAHFFPVGTPGLFKTYFGPADFIETVNTRGLPRYAKMATDDDFQRYVKIHAQTNPLTLCMRPRVLIKAKRT